MRTMAQEGGHGQHHSHNRHGQADSFFTPVMCVFRAFFQFFYIHCLLLEDEFNKSSDMSCSLRVLSTSHRYSLLAPARPERGQFRCRNLSRFCGRVWSGTSSYFKTLMEPSTSSTANAASLVHATPCSRSARLSSSMEMCSFAIWLVMHSPLWIKRVGDPWIILRKRRFIPESSASKKFSNSNTTAATAPPISEVSGPVMAFCTELLSRSRSVRSKGVICPTSRFPVRRIPTSTRA